MAARFAGPDGRELIGYTDRWSVAPGERIQLMASASASAVTVRLVGCGTAIPIQPVPACAPSQCHRR